MGERRGDESRKGIETLLRGIPRAIMGLGAGLERHISFPGHKGPLGFSMRTHVKEPVNREELVLAETHTGQEGFVFISILKKCFIC